MNSASSLRHGEGKNIDIPPLFNGHYYTRWKERMDDFLQSKDYELWIRVTDGLLMVQLFL